MWNAISLVQKLSFIIINTVGLIYILITTVLIYRTKYQFEKINLHIDLKNLIPSINLKIDPLTKKKKLILFFTV